MKRQPLEVRRISTIQSRVSPVAHFAMGAELRRIVENVGASSRSEPVKAKAEVTRWCNSLTCTVRQM
jgi:hypothetical protein